MKNFGTVAQLEAANSDDFQNRVEQIITIAGRRFGYGDPLNAGLTVNVEFLAMSKRGDVYMVHVADPSREHLASGRITQLFDGHGGQVLGDP